MPVKFDELCAELLQVDFQHAPAVRVLLHAKVGNAVQKRKFVRGDEFAFAENALDVTQKFELLMLCRFQGSVL